MNEHKVMLEGVNTHPTRPLMYSTSTLQAASSVVCGRDCTQQIPLQRSLYSGCGNETGYCGYPCAQKSSDPPNVILMAIGDDRWSEVDCVVYPWYDCHGARFEDVWILDVDQGLLLWRTPQSFLSLSLAQLCA